MRFRQLLTFVLTLLAPSATLSAAEVQVTMNRVSTSMTLKSQTTGDVVEVGEPTSYVYNFDAPAGRYTLTAYGTDNTTVNGTIDFEVTDGGENLFQVITCTAYVTNRNADKSYWTTGAGDYTFTVEVATRDGDPVTQSVGSSTTAGRLTFLALNGCSYYAGFIPSDKHVEEGYLTATKSGMLTGNINVTASIPMGADLSVTVPQGASLQFGSKKTHFIDFLPVAPDDSVVTGSAKNYKFRLPIGGDFNYRVSKPGALTWGGHFSVPSDAADMPDLTFTDAMLAMHDPKAVNHSVQSNNGYETGDIFVNVNKEGFKAMSVGEVFKAHAMRSWELADNSTNNYFIEPDFHYTVIGLDGKESNGVLTVSQKPGSAWADIKAVGAGTAIVLVTYDGINLNTYNNKGERSDYLGGSYWGAIWPENTAAYVIAVGQPESVAKPEMLINEDYNTDTKKVAGKYVDAECDVFYYLENEEGFRYTFAAADAAKVTIAYPTIGEHSATYTGFGTDGVTDNGDDTYTVLLREGRQIVSIADASGNATYQVFTAKPCTRTVTNESRPGSTIFQPGDKIKVQYAGLRHPANKLAGIYNMSANVTYNGVPNGTSLILGSGQYTFGSAASAQAITFTVPDTLDVEKSPTIDFTRGVIQVNGFGDPIGNHRFINPETGRNANFTAIAHKTFFGAIPEFSIALTPVKYFDIKLSCDVSDVTYDVTFDGKKLEVGDDGMCRGTYGTYTVTVAKPGYRRFVGNFIINEDAEGTQLFEVELVAAPGAWDGTTKAEPSKNESGAYVIGTPAEFAWFADAVNGGDNKIDALLTSDIDLGDYEWTPVGNNSHQFYGTFTGAGHTVKDLYVSGDTNYRGLFGYVRGTSDKTASVTGLTVYGEVAGRSYVGAVVGYLYSYASVDTCASYAAVSSSNNYCGGVVGYIGQSTSSVANCYNAGSVRSGYTHGGVVGGYGTNADNISNIFNVGEIQDNNSANACVGNTRESNKIANAYAVADYANTYGYTLVGEQQMASGEIAYKLGEAFGQKIGTDAHPVFGGARVLFNTETGEYYNDNSAIGAITTDGIVPEGYYNLQGIRSATPWDGFNIVRMSDGSSCKIFINYK